MSDKHPTLGEAYWGFLDSQIKQFTPPSKEKQDMQALHNRHKREDFLKSLIAIDENKFPKESRKRDELWDYHIFHFTKLKY